VWRRAAARDVGEPGDKIEVTGVILAYQDALNASDAEAAVRLYADDGVLMPEHNPSVVGKAAIQKIYAAGSKIFALHVKFTIAEVVQLAPTWAFLRTNTAGTMKMIETGAIVPEANQELFILRKDSTRQWKIVRYSFSSINPVP
jgi:uncharacterized protein (TIGR02246 family)